MLPQSWTQPSKWKLSLAPVNPCPAQPNTVGVIITDATNLTLSQTFSQLYVDWLKASQHSWAIYLESYDFGNYRSCTQGYLSHHHGWWCPGSWQHQVISNHVRQWDCKAIWVTIMADDALAPGSTRLSTTMLDSEIVRLSESPSWLMMPWLLAAPGHQQPRC